MSEPLDEILAPDLLNGLTERALDEVRTLRDKAKEVEDGLSYVRKMVQGRIEIVRAVLKERSAGHDPRDLSDLIGQLPDLLSDHQPAPGSPSRSPRMLELSAVTDELAAELDEIVATHDLADLRQLSEADLDALVLRLAEFEGWVSETRLSVQARLDALQAEIVRRYRDGEASVDDLLA